MGNNDDAKKQKIKRAAKELFFRFGFNKTSMDDIALQSGMAKATLYYYYSNKEEIFNEVVIDEATQFMNTMEKKLPADAPADEKLAAFFKMLYSGLEKYAQEISRLPDTMCHQYPHGQPIVRRINQLVQEKLQPLIREGHTGGIFSVDGHSSTLSALVYMTNFLNLDWMRTVPKNKRDDIIESAIQIVLNGIRRR